MDSKLEKIKERWNENADMWNQFRTDSVIAKIIENPYSIFREQLQSMLKNFITDFNGKRVLVPASGDNRAVFAFHLLGASVISLDISDKQLEYSAAVAKKHGWNIEFICDDVMNLSKINSNEYDFVYISNGVMFWIDNLESMYSNICRVLKDGGFYMMYDLHPFMLPFDYNDTTQLVIKKDYDSIGPFGNLSTFDWRLQDILNAIISSGLHIKHIEEMHAEYGTFWVDNADSMTKEELNLLFDSKTNPLFALPQCISICAQKIRTA